MSKTTLDKKYSFTILLVTLCALVVMIAIVAWQLNRSAVQLKQQSGSSFAEETAQQLRQRGLDLTEYLAHNIGEPYLSFDMLALYELILPVKQSSGVKQVYFYDLQGGIRHDGTREIAVYGEQVEDFYPDIDLTLPNVQFIYLDSSIAIARPVITVQNTLGGVVLELSTEPFLASLNSMQTRLDEVSQKSMQGNLTILISTGLLMVVAAGIAAMMAGRRLAKPVTELSKQAERIGHGDYDTNVSVDRIDEIGDLAQAFEYMRVSLKEQKERIEYQAYYDALTGIRNRNSFHMYMSDVLIHSKEGEKHVLVYVDIDGFKRINDALGHGAGDRLLKELADRLKAWAKLVGSELSANAKCEIGRWGGDQFVILISGLKDTEGVRQQTTDLLNSFARPCNIAGMEIVMSSSIGYAVYPDDARDSDALMSYADLAMYQSKERGRNLVSAYFHQSGSRAHFSLVLESEIRTAFRENQFELLYSPIIDATSRVTKGFEQLVIWNHPERGVLKPRQFMSALVSAGLREDFRYWGFNAGLDHLKSWQKQGFGDLHVAFNLVSLDFDPNWLGNIAAEGLERTQIDSRDVQFEISESHFSNNMMRTTEVLRDLLMFDIGVWIDNFGTGYTALNRLRRMPIQGIKLHSSVIANLDSSQEDQNMVAASIAMAHGLGFAAGADGVVTEQQAKFLRKKGCDTIQGRLIQSPLSVKEIEPYLASPNPAGPRLQLTS